MSVGGDIIFVDATGAKPFLSLSGAAVNTSILTDVLPRGGKTTLYWSAYYAGMFVL